MTMREEDSFQKALQEHEQSEPTEADLQAAYDRARSIGLFLVEKYAREALREHPEYSEFVMAMGVWGFDLHGALYVEVSELLLDLMEKWDDVLRLTGEPTRFTAGGPVRREW